MGGLKICLLDIDGVLLPFGEGIDPHPSSSSSSSSSSSLFPLPHLANLERIIRETDAKVVLSSTWRCVPEALESIVACFEEYGGALSKCTHSHYTRIMITDPAKHDVRQWEIVDWIQNIAPSKQLKIDNWVALDDDVSVRDNPRFASFCQNHYVITESHEGLTEEKAREAIFILNDDGINGTTQ